MDYALHKGEKKILPIITVSPRSTNKLKMALLGSSQGVHVTQPTKGSNFIFPAKILNNQ